MASANRGYGTYRVHRGPAALMRVTEARAATTTWE